MSWKTTIISLGFMSPLFILLFASWRPYRGPTSTRVIVEIGQLQSAVQWYEEKYGEYFPCLAEPNRDDRKVRFMKHLAKAFPQSTYGVTPADFDKLNTQVQTGFSRNGQEYKFLDAQDNIRPLDLATIDAAESLVFWLGGFPTPIDPQQKTPIANRRIFGLHRDADDPIRRDAKHVEGHDPLRYRTDPLYQFDETRLVDQDDDGWLEYIPWRSQSNGVFAPFVYFDARCYAATSNAPKVLGSVRYPDDPKLADVFGYISPYVSSYNPATHAVTWHCPDSFQIISGGLDELFHLPDAAFVQRVVIVPSGQVFQPAGPNQQEALTTEEQDNLTNLTPDTLEGWRQAAGS
ncbi:MAG: hypothetical protein JNL96_26810 [Planctomycetaceae bacterium]|nr:hypothetical protein [Planctomycetaceae bacterium]